MDVVHSAARLMTLLLPLLAACSGGQAGGDGPPIAPATYLVGGTVTGLSGLLVLRNNGGDDLDLTANGAFAFATALANGAAYRVTVASQPANQSCTVGNGSGTVAGASVTNVAVACTATPPSGGSGSLDPGFGSGGRVTTDFSGAPPAR